MFSVVAVTLVIILVDAHGIVIILKSFEPWLVNSKVTSKSWVTLDINYTLPAALDITIILPVGV